MTKRQQWFIIGISGVTCGGKTSLANRLKESLTPAYVFHQDKFFFPDDSAQHVRVPGLPHNNYDVLGALDMPRMLHDISLTIAGQDRAEARSLDDADHKFKVPGIKFMIIEGFTALNYKPINEMCDLRYYFVLEYGECLMRRVYRLYDPPDIDGYFDQCVWPEHLKYRAQIEKDPRVKFLDGTKADAFETVMADVRALFGG